MRTGGGSVMSDISMMILVIIAAIQVTLLGVLRSTDIKMSECRVRIERSKWENKTR